MEAAVAVDVIKRSAFQGKIIIQKKQQRIYYEII